MSGATPESAGERSSQDGLETGLELPTLETGPISGSATTRFEPSPTAPDDEEELDTDLARLLAPPTDPAALGRLDHYEILRLVGRGGMGRVFQAFDTVLQRTVAVKILAAPLAISAMARRRFLREARAAAKLNHPNIVTVHAVGEHADIPYLVMEYVGGGSLSDRIRAAAPLPPAEVIRLGAQAAHGLAAAHAQGLIHRDVKPANLLLDEMTGRVKITDFGLAQATLDPSESASPGQTAGTPSFLAPELLAGVPATPRSDLFSFGCVLYAMVDGGSPFRGTQFAAVAKRLTCDTPLPLDRIDPRVPRALAELVAGLLEKEPEARRPATAAEVAARLDELAAAPAEAPRAAPRRLRARALLAAVALLLVLAGLAGRWRRGGGGAPAPVAKVVPSTPRQPGEPLVLEDGLNWIHALAVSPNGLSVLAGGGPDHDARLWDLPGGQVRQRLKGHESWVQTAAFSPDGRFAVTGSGGSWKVVNRQRPGGDDFTVRLWRESDGALLQTYRGHTGPVTGVAFSSDGRFIVSSSRDHTVRLWRRDGDTAPVREFVGPAEVFCVAFTPNGDHVLSGTWDGATFWNVSDGTSARSLGGHVGPVLAVAVSPNGRRAATAGDDGSVRLWSLDEGKELRTWTRHAGRVSALAWSRDGRRLVSAGADGRVRLWDVDSETLLAELPPVGLPIDSVTFSPDGGRALAGCGDGAVRVWGLAAVTAHARAKLQ